MLFGRNLGEVDQVEMLFQELLGLSFGLASVIEDVQGGEILVFGIDPVACKSAAKSV
ncbi:hypothetical protein SDC9_136783 [bioreactor metagenome]|uniref:Uncharacterized protein n=1 Tax=bioreactor metagenome TaxID=1076179 RepID=A0A645DK96_9ZZZZ